jgi:hypothetical protein
LQASSNGDFNAHNEKPQLNTEAAAAAAAALMLSVAQLPEQRQHGGSIAGGLLQAVMDGSTAAPAASEAAAAAAAGAGAAPMDTKPSSAAPQAEAQELPAHLHLQQGPAAPAGAAAHTAARGLPLQQQRPSPPPSCHNGAWEAALDVMLGSMAGDSADGGGADGLDLSHLFGGQAGIDDALAWLDVGSPAEEGAAAGQAQGDGRLSVDEGSTSLRAKRQLKAAEKWHHRRLEAAEAEAQQQQRLQQTQQQQQQQATHHRRSSSTDCSIVQQQQQPQHFLLETAAAGGFQQHQVPRGAPSAPISVPSAGHHMLGASYQQEQQSLSCGSMHALQPSQQQAASSPGSAPHVLPNGLLAEMLPEHAYDGSWQQLLQRQQQQQQQQQLGGMHGSAGWLEVRQAKRQRQEAPGGAQPLSRSSSGHLGSMPALWQQQAQQQAQLLRPSRPITMLGAPSSLPAGAAAMLGGSPLTPGPCPPALGHAWGLSLSHAGLAPMVARQAGAQAGAPHLLMDDMQLMREFGR